MTQACEDDMKEIEMIKTHCLYETWPSYKEFGENRTNLVLAAFNVEWLSAGKDTLAAPRALPKGPSGHR